MNRRQSTATALCYSHILGANGRLQMGFTGLGTRGDRVHEGFLEYGGSRTAAIRGLRDNYLDFASAKSRALQGLPEAPRKQRCRSRRQPRPLARPPVHWNRLHGIDGVLPAYDVSGEAVGKFPDNSLRPGEAFYSIL